MTAFIPDPQTLLMVGAFSHHLKGNVELGSVLWVTVGAVLGIFISGQIIHLISPVILKRCFAAVLILVSIKMLS